MEQPCARPRLAVTFAGSGDAFGSGGRHQACVHLRAPGQAPVLLDCGATSLSAIRGQGLDPGEVSTVFISHLHGDHFGGLPFLILDGQFQRRTSPLSIVGPPGTADRLRRAMETSFPGSSGASRRFGVNVTELVPGGMSVVNDIQVEAWEVDHPSGAVPLALRLGVGGTTIAYTGDTAWTESLVPASDGSDLLIAEAYYYDKVIPYHLRYVDLVAHQASLNSRRIVLTHMSADMLARVAQGRLAFAAASDGLVVQV